MIRYYAVMILDKGLVGGNSTLPDFRVVPIAAVVFPN